MEQKLTIKELLAGIAKQVNDARAEFKANFNLLADRMQKLENERHFRKLDIKELPSDLNPSALSHRLAQMLKDHQSIWPMGSLNSKIYNVSTRIIFSSIVTPDVFDRVSKEAWDQIKKFCEENGIDEIHLDAKKQ